MNVKSFFNNMFIVLLSAMNIFYFGISHAQDRDGEATQPTGNARKIKVNASTTYVDVKTGETITFIIDGKSFTRKFDGTTIKSKFELSKIAPEGILNHEITIYIDRTPPDNS